MVPSIRSRAFGALSFTVLLLSISLTVPAFAAGPKLDPHGLRAAQHEGTGNPCVTADLRGDSGGSAGPEIHPNH